MSNQYTKEISLADRLSIIKMYDDTRGMKPKVSMAAIGEKHGVHKDTVDRTIKNRDGYEKRARCEGLGQTEVRPSPPADAHRKSEDITTPRADNASHIVLVIPDLHCPWEHPDALEFLKAVRRAYKPTKIVCLGDEVDFYGMSRFDHDPDMINPGNELSLAVKHLIPFYREFPEVLICQSNHTHRVHAKAQKAGLPSSTIRHIEDILKTPEGWVYKQCHRIDNVDYKHGTGKSGPQAHINHAKATGRSTCIGHIHAYGAVNYLRPGLFAANFACLIDKSGGCFSYASEMDDNIVLGCGLVMHGKEAHFIPMRTDSNNRWVGKLHT